MGKITSDELVSILAFSYNKEQLKQIHEKLDCVRDEIDRNIKKED